MAEAGLADSSLQLNGLRSEQEIYAAVRGLVHLDNPPTALFTSHYLVTLGAIRALHDLHLEQQVALIGFDDLVLADLVRPAITVMAPDPTRSARSRPSAPSRDWTATPHPCRPSSSRRSSSPAVLARSHHPI